LAAIAEAVTAFSTCRNGPHTNRPSCASDQTVTMLATHARIAAVREACNACAYPSSPSSSRPSPPKVRFADAAVLAYNANVNVFIASTFTRCNLAAMDSSVVVSADTGGDLLAAYTDICAIRTACIAAGNPPAPALPIAHPGEILICSHLPSNGGTSMSVLCL